MATRTEGDIRPGTPGTSTQEVGVAEVGPPPEARPDLLTVNMGPPHPSTHGVLRVELVLDGEMVVRCRPVIGYLHTGIEKTFESKSYIQGVVLTDRMDYLNPLGNNLAYALSVEKLCGCDIPP